MEEEIGHQMSRGEGSPDIYRADPVFFNRDGMEKYWGVSYVDNKGGNDGGKGCLAVFTDSILIEKTFTVSPVFMSNFIRELRI